MKITKLYSDYDEYYDEKLYSTGNEDLDELLERAFCEGYEYAQREFAFPSLGSLRNQFVRNKAAKTARQLRKAGQYMQGPEMAKRVTNLGGNTSLISSLKGEGKEVMKDANLLVQGIQKTAPKGGKLGSNDFKTLMTAKSGWRSQLLGQQSKEAKAMNSALFGNGKNAKALNTKITNAANSGKY